MNTNPLESFHNLFGADTIEPSLAEAGPHRVGLVRRNGLKTLAILTPAGAQPPAGFKGKTEPLAEGSTLTLCPQTAGNGLALRALLGHLKPVPLGLAPSFGFGDRLGLATAGHAASLSQITAQYPSTPFAPIFCQQSIREMTRTRRNPAGVMADAVWGAFEAGWRAPQGADADHLKTTADIDACADAGFTFFTIDPGDYVDDGADDASPQAIEKKVAALPWAELQSSPADLASRLAEKTWPLEGHTPLTTSKAQILRAAAKYGGAVAHVARMAGHLAAKGVAWELEVSVDETQTPTTPAEHCYVATELARLGVKWVSLAPRLPGRMEKGVDYIGDREDLAVQLATHAAIARTLGPYKLSLHSGSDKLSIYGMLYEATGGCVHVKTAGTSYLEALRVVAKVDPALLRTIGTLGRERYPIDRATYHVSAELERVPPMDQVKDSELAALLDDFHARQVFHVTYGSALDQFGDQIKALLRANEALHYETLAHHFGKHLRSLLGKD